MHLANVQLNRRRRRRIGFNQHGYTLPELLIGTAISLTALAAFFSFHRFQLYAMVNQSNQLELQTIGRNLLDLVSGEIRRAGEDPTCSKSFDAIAQASSNAIRIQSDLNGNGVIDAAGEDVTYSYDLSSQSVQRTSGGVTEPITDSHIQFEGAELQYYDGAGNQLTSATGALSAAQRTSIRRVRVILNLQTAGVDPQNTTLLRANMTSNVDIRNRFFVTSTACP